MSHQITFESTIAVSNTTAVTAAIPSAFASTFSAAFTTTYSSTIKSTFPTTQRSAIKTTLQTTNVIAFQTAIITTDGTAQQSTNKCSKLSTNATTIHIPIVKSLRATIFTTDSVSNMPTLIHSIEDAQCRTDTATQSPAIPSSF
jgi:hypothetical protein